MVRKSITAKLSLGFTAVVLISVLLIGTLFIQVFKGYIFETKRASMLDRARDISSVTSQYLSDNPAIRGYGAFVRLLDKLVGAKIWITDISGNVVIMSGDSGNPKSPPSMSAEDKGLVNHVLSGAEWSGESFSSLYEEPTLTVGIPVYDTDKNVIGSVFLHAPVTGITEVVDKAFNILLVCIALATVISTILGVLFSSFLTRPLKLMNSTALEIAGGNYNVRTSIAQSDEIGTLSESFDLMASNLSHTIEELFQEKNKLGDIISSISDGLIAFDTDMNVINRNEMALALLGYESEDDIPSRIAGDLKSYGMMDKISGAMSSGIPAVHTIEKDGSHIRFTVSPVRSSAGDIIGTVSLIRDISESENLEKLRREFVANVSHELRTPLTIIRGSIEAISDGTVSDPEDVRSFHNNIRTESIVLEKLVSDLLDISRLESSKISLIMEKVDLAAICDDAVRSITRVAYDKGISIKFDHSQEIPFVMADYHRIRQVLVIFVDNALKYSPPETEVTVSIRKDDSGYVHIMVEDQGYGIPQKDMPHVWDRFYMVDKSGGTNEKSSGLGLSIAKLIIELHGGVLDLESEVGKGTRIGFGLKYQI